MTRTGSISVHYSVNQFIDEEMDLRIILGPLSVHQQQKAIQRMPSEGIFSMASWLAIIDAILCSISSLRI